MITLMLPNHIPEVVELHLSVLGYTLNAKLGLRHLNHLYRVILQEQQNGLVLVSLDNNGRVDGFISACRDLQKIEVAINKSFAFLNYCIITGYFFHHPGDLRKLVSHYLFSRHLRLKYPSPFASILTLGVDPYKQRSGIGRLLICELVRYFAGSSVRTLYVDTLVTNYKAIHFYEKQDFNPLETVWGNLILAKKIA